MAKGENCRQQVDHLVPVGDGCTIPSWVFELYWVAEAFWLSAALIITRALALSAGAHKRKRGEEDDPPGWSVWLRSFYVSFGACVCLASWWASVVCFMRAVETLRQSGLPACHNKPTPNLGPET